MNQTEKQTSLYNRKRRIYHLKRRRRDEPFFSQRKSILEAQIKMRK